MSNAIGSNVFDIDLGLGLPFLIRIIIQAGQPMMLLDDEEQVNVITLLSDTVIICWLVWACMAHIMTCLLSGQQKCLERQFPI